MVRIRDKRHALLLGNHPAPGHLCPVGFANNVGPDLLVIQAHCERTFVVKCCGGHGGCESLAGQTAQESANHRGDDHQYKIASSHVRHTFAMVLRKGFADKYYGSMISNRPRAERHWSKAQGPHSLGLAPFTFLFLALH
jgi:hypothetical protein